MAMSNFRSYQDITNRLNKLADKLNSAQLKEDELEEFQELARELYERTVVLNYKAKEEKVYSLNGQTKSKESDKQSFQKEAEETQQEQRKPENELSSNVEEDSSGEIQFDFSSDEEEKHSNPDQNDLKEDSVEEPEKSDAVSKHASPQEIDSLVEQTTEEETSNDLTTASQTDAELNDTFEDEKVQSFYEQFEKFHNASLGDRLGASKLDTLKGAIGLNDKLQFISELFEGDSEAFNSSIDRLDKQESNKNARKLLSQIASKQSWDEENPLVEEFARLIERRYVED